MGTVNSISLKKTPSYSNLFDKVSEDKWESCKEFAKEYDEGKYTDRTEWKMYFSVDSEEQVEK